VTSHQVGCQSTPRPESPRFSPASASLSLFSKRWWHETPDGGSDVHRGLEVSRMRTRSCWWQPYPEWDIVQIDHRRVWSGLNYLCTLHGREHHQQQQPVTPSPPHPFCRLPSRDAALGRSSLARSQSCCQARFCFRILGERHLNASESCATQFEAYPSPIPRDAPAESKQALKNSEPTLECRRYSSLWGS
jgi:hypothetical protein